MTFTLRARHVVLGMLLVLLGAAMPLVVLANHDFTDVPTGSTFHGDISRVKGAGITSGCGGGKYCPDEPVLRGQMAGFLVRTGSRAAYDTNGFAFGITTDTELASVTVRGSNVAGGTALVKLDASYYVYTNGSNETNCDPCQIDLRIARVGGGISIYSVAKVFNQSATDQEIESGGITWAVAIPTGEDVTFRLEATRSDGTGSMNGVGALTAVVVPFNESGNNPVLSPVAGPGADAGDPTPTR